MKREKWCRSRVCLRDEVAACNSTVAASATLSRDKVAAMKSRDKIARVTSVLFRLSATVKRVYSCVREKRSMTTVS